VRGPHQCLLQGEGKALESALGLPCSAAQDKWFGLSEPQSASLDTGVPQGGVSSGQTNSVCGCGPQAVALSKWGQGPCPQCLAQLGMANMLGLLSEHLSVKKGVMGMASLLHPFVCTKPGSLPPRCSAVQTLRPGLTQEAETTTDRTEQRSEETEAGPAGDTHPSPGSVAPQGVCAEVLKVHCLCLPTGTCWAHAHLQPPWAPLKASVSSPRRWAQT
jgi:hypothetical protein